MIIYLVETKDRLSVLFGGKFANDELFVVECEKVGSNPFPLERVYISNVALANEFVQWADASVQWVNYELIYPVPLEGK